MVIEKKSNNGNTFSCQIEADPEIEKISKLTGQESYDLYGLKRDETFTVTAVFPNNVEIDIKCVISDGDYYNWCEAVLIKNGCEIGCTEPQEDFLGKWELEDSAGNKYLIDVVPALKQSINNSAKEQVEILHIDYVEELKDYQPNLSPEKYNEEFHDNNFPETDPELWNKVKNSYKQKTDSYYAGYYSIERELFEKSVKDGLSIKETLKRFAIEDDGNTWEYIYTENDLKKLGQLESHDIIIYDAPKILGNKLNIEYSDTAKYRLPDINKKMLVSQLKSKKIKL